MKSSLVFCSIISGVFIYAQFDTPSKKVVRKVNYFTQDIPHTSNEPRKPEPKKTGPGPTAPEVQKFTPFSVTELVDPFTGDFSYSIPLMDIEGYPLTLTYNSGVKPEDEASNVGLGWNLNIGQVTRNMRGLPDDFNGDAVTKSLNLKERVTVGGSLNASLELFGFDPTFAISLGSNTTLKYNNYTGLGLDFGYNLGITATKTEKMQTSDTSTFKAALNVGVQFSTSGPPSFMANGGIDLGTKNGLHKSSYGGNFGTSINSLEGVKGINFSASMNATRPNGSFSGGNLALGQSFDYSFSRPAAVPPSQFPMISVATSTRVGVSGEITGIAPGASIEGFKQTENLAYKTEDIPAFGYLYQENNKGVFEKSLLDFNREKDGAYIKQAPILPIPVPTYDVYSVSGQGISGSFRPFRNDIVTVHDPLVVDGSFSLNAGAQVKAGNIAGVGIDITAGAAGNLITKWELFNGLNGTFSFQSQQSGDLLGHAYFRNVGEFTVLANEDDFNKLGGTNPVRAQLGLQAIPTSTLVNQYGTSFALGSGAFRKKEREPRNIVFSYLTAEEAKIYGQDRKIHNYAVNQLTKQDIDRMDEVRKKDHLSEIRILRNDGVSYYYGIPAYNTKYKEVAFNASSNTVSAQENLISYSGTDNSTDNLKGDNNYFSSTELPPYAYAYLLSSITSPEYVDVTDNGPSPDDFGTYTKFNYSRVHSNFAWRTPYAGSKAYFNPGYLADDKDNNGSYVFGEKEIWYVNSIESKNFIAQFILADRFDALAVIDDNGGVNENKKLKCISSIRLFSKSELKKRGSATRPVKTVDFVYDYKLARGVPGSRSDSGKLTLRELRVSYYSSEKEKQSPYRFTYYGENTRYKANATDRWGMFKNTNVNDLPAQDFPYTKQDPIIHSEVSQWNLSSIVLPTGGKINIEYEADDYGFVQDKRAMEMISVAGFLRARTDNVLQEKLYSTIPSFVAPTNDNSGQILENINPYIVFKLKRSLQSGDREKLYEYIKGIGQLYFNFRVAILNETATSNKDHYEKVDGFIDLGSIDQNDTDAFGFWSSTAGSEYSMAYVRISKFPQHLFLKVHPVTWQAWQKAKSMLPLIYERNAVALPADFTPASFTGWLVESLSTGVDNFLKLILGYYEMMYALGRGSMVDVSKSFIRLNSYDHKKYGGDLRVKRITVNDNWGTMQSTANPNLNFSYGQTYEYTTLHNSRLISSGVAAYEPTIGAEENGLIEQDAYSVDRVLAPADVLNTLRPYGESFYQSPVVGYSRVKISNIHRNEKLKRKGPGFSVHEFYTAKDFPTKTKQTIKAREEFYLPTNPLVDIINHTAAQGFYVETNNMHGKPKSFSLFAETDTINAFRSTRYFYKSNPAIPNELDNTALVAYKGVIAPRLIGIDFDLIADARHIVNLNGALDVQMNVDYFQAGPVPVIVPVPVPWPSFSLHELKTHAITKVVQRSGILDSVQEVNNGTISTAFNVLFDGITGEVLVTKHSDDFGDHYYSTAIPAYWIEKNMGPAYQNIGYYQNAVSISSGQGTITDANKIFSVGDKLKIQNGSSGYGWVSSVSGNNITIIDESGALIPNGAYDLKIVSSGKRNMTNLHAGEIITKAYPINNGKLNFSDVIDASAIEFKDRWQTYQGIRINYPAYKCVCTPHQANQALLRNIFDRLAGFELCQDTSLNVTINNDSFTMSILITEDGLKLRLKGGQRFEDGCEIILRDTAFYRMSRAGKVKGPIKAEKECWKLKFSNLAIIPGSDCDQSNKFLVQVTINTGPSQKDMGFEGSFSCFMLNNCDLVEDGIASTECNIGEVGTMNPFLAGTLNNWRPSSNYKYVTGRTYENPSINKKGFYRDFIPFWSMNEYGIALQQTGDKSKWTRADSATIIDPFGHTLESKNIIGNYSSALFGYGFTMPVATAQNARQNDLAVENFEDYDFNNRIGVSDETRCILPPHWKLSGLQNITSDESHSGRYSWEVKSDTSFLNLRMAERSCNTNAQNSFNGCDLIRNFSPSKNKYKVSTWVKVKQCRLPAPQSGIAVTCFYETVPPGESNAIYITLSRIEQSGIENMLVQLSPVGKMIEGWQLFTGEFEILTENYKSIQFKAVKSPQAESATLRTQVFLDDIRIHPKNANMETYVYDPQTLRMLAKLDVENFATFYGYDMEGNVSHIKKETEKGVKTLQEIRTAKPKSNQLNIQ